MVDMSPQFPIFLRKFEFYYWQYPVKRAVPLQTLSPFPKSLGIITIISIIYGALALC